MTKHFEQPKQFSAQEVVNATTIRKRMQDGVDAIYAANKRRNDDLTFRRSQAEQMASGIADPTRRRAFIADIMSAHEKEIGAQHTEAIEKARADYGDTYGLQNRALPSKIAMLEYRGLTESPNEFSAAQIAVSRMVPAQLRRYADTLRTEIGQDGPTNKQAAAISALVGHVQGLERDRKPFHPESLLAEIPTPQLDAGVAILKDAQRLRERFEREYIDALRGGERGGLKKIRNGIDADPTGEKRTARLGAPSEERAPAPTLSRRAQARLDALEGRPFKMEDYNADE